MANGIGCAHKLGKKNRQQPDVTNEPLNATSSTSQSHDKSIENINVTSKESLSVEAYFSTKTALKYSTYDPIQTKPLSIPHTTNMLDTNVTVDDKSQYLTVPRKHNHSANIPSAQVLLVYDRLQCQHKKTTHITRTKLSPYGNEYICFQTDR